MKITSIKFLVFGFLCLALGSCKKEENRVILEGGTAPTLTATYLTTPLLKQTEKDNPAVSFSWTAPEYKLNTGPNSHDITYLIQADTVGSNFSRPAEVSISNDFSHTMTVGEFNNLLANPNNLALVADMPHDIEMRVVSAIGSARLPSNVFTFTGVIPYEEFAVQPPSTGNLFITGSATPGGWQAGTSGEAVPPNQQFTRLAKGIYEIPSIMLNGGQSYLLLPEYGSWATKYGGTGATNNSNDPFSDTFKEGGSDLIAPSLTGNYKIEVSFKTGKFTVTKL